MVLNSLKRTYIVNENLRTVLNTKEKEKTYRYSRTVRALLSGISLSVCAALCIYGVVEAKTQTESLIKKNQENSIQKKIISHLPPEATAHGMVLKCFEISNKSIGHNQKLFVAVKEPNILGYVMTYSTSMGYSDPLVLITGFTKDKKVYKADIHFSQETPGLGDKVDREHGNFLDMLNGYGLNDAKFDVKKNGGDFDYITGATITSRATVVATYNALKVLNTVDLGRLKKCRGF